MTDLNQDTAETTAEDVTLSSEETEVENTEAETTVESTEDSDTPSEGDNTSEDESTDDAVERLSPRYERDNKRLNDMLKAREEEIERLKTGNAQAPSSLTPGVQTPSPAVGSYELARLAQEIETLKAQQNKEVEERWWTEDQKKFDEVLVEFPELKKDTDLLRMIKNDARMSVTKEGEVANYLKTARALNKKFKFAKDQGREEAAERETVIGQTSTPSAKKGSAATPRKFDDVKNVVVRKDRLTTGDIADLIGAARTS